MSTSPIPSSWCEIHCDRISNNLELTLGLVPDGVGFCAVLKADAYGHGIARVVPLLLEQGVSVVGITSNAEARAVRKAGFSGRLMRLRAATPQEMTEACADRVEEQVGSLWAAKHLRQNLASGSRPIGVHLALNSDGMSRDGLEVSTKAGQQECWEILDEIGPHVVGICTHFPSNEPALLRQNSDLFKQQVAWIYDYGSLKRSDILAHAGSTLTLLSGEQIETDLYRCGAILYGILNPELGFRPSMELKSRVVHLGDYPKGATVGYDRDCLLETDRRLKA
ncbi:alanine racemase [Shimia sediminis]|uniref:alanine racemase n=1 Tax=Shimia sediminis TaxID=2497945 RepID=UPI000F8D31C3|nr:alanine racemase [Shimia sediminis]